MHFLQWKSFIRQCKTGCWYISVIQYIKSVDWYYKCIVLICSSGPGNFCRRVLQWIKQYLHGVPPQWMVQRHWWPDPWYKINATRLNLINPLMRNHISNHLFICKGQLSSVILSCSGKRKFAAIFCYIGSRKFATMYYF